MISAAIAGPQRALKTEQVAQALIFLLQLLLLDDVLSRFAQLLLQALVFVRGGYSQR